MPILRVLDHYGHVYIDRGRNLAFGIDKVRVSGSSDGWELANETGEPRLVQVIFEDGSVQEVMVSDSVVVLAGPALQEE